jgi:hypothetical protein
MPIIGGTSLRHLAGRPQKPTYTFGVYLEEVFFPLCRRKWKESTRMTTEGRIRHHLLPAFKSCLLAQISHEQMQLLLDETAPARSRSTA